MKLRGVSKPTSTGRFSVYVWEKSTKKLLHAGVYDSEIEGSVAHDIMRIMLDRRFGLLTTPEKLNHPIESYDVVVNREEALAIRKMQAAAIATRGGPSGPKTMAALNNLRLRVGRVVVLRVKRIPARNVIDGILNSVEKRFCSLFGGV